MPSILCTKPLELVMLVDNSGSGAMNLMPQITQTIDTLSKHISFGQIVQVSRNRSWAVRLTTSVRCKLVSVHGFCTLAR